MTDEIFLTNVHEFLYELGALLVRCDLHKPDIAAGLVAKAVTIAASDGCDANEQMESIVKFADNAITRLECLSQPREARH